MASKRSSLAQRERLDEVIAFWSPQRLASAKPVEQITGAARPAPVSAPPSPLPGKFITQPILNPASDPHYRRAGKLYVRFGEEAWYASACAVNENGVLTAAHCLYDRESQQYATLGLYMPGYQEGESSLGSFTLIGEPAVPEGWISTGSRDWDYGFSRVHDSDLDRNETLGDVTGIFTVASNLSPKRDWHTLGYPSKPAPPYGFDGQMMWGCYGPKTRDIGNVIGKEGNLTTGSSGGPWLIPGTEYVNGVQSVDNSLIPDENFSPYFDDAVLGLYNAVFRF